MLWTQNAYLKSHTYENPQTLQCNDHSAFLKQKYPSRWKQGILEGFSKNMSTLREILSCDCSMSSGEINEPTIPSDYFLS